MSATAKATDNYETCRQLQHAQEIEDLNRIVQRKEDIIRAMETRIAQYREREIEWKKLLEVKEHQETELRKSIKQLQERASSLERTIMHYRDREMESKSKWKPKEVTNVSMTAERSPQTPLTSTPFSQTSPDSTSIVSTAFSTTSRLTKTLETCSMIQEDNESDENDDCESKEHHSIQADKRIIEAQSGPFDVSAQELRQEKTEPTLLKETFKILIVSEALTKELEAAMKELGNKESKKLGPFTCISIETDIYQELFTCWSLHAFNLILFPTTSQISDAILLLALHCWKQNIPYIFVRHKMWLLREELQAEMSGVSEHERKANLENILSIKLEQIYKEFDDTMQRVSLPKRDETGPFFLIDDRNLYSFLRGDRLELVFDELKLVEYIMSLRKSHAKMLWDNLVGTSQDRQEIVPLSPFPY